MQSDELIERTREVVTEDGYLVISDAIKHEIGTILPHDYIACRIQGKITYLGLPLRVTSVTTREEKLRQTIKITGKAFPSPMPYHYRAEVVD